MEHRGRRRHVIRLARRRTRQSTRLILAAALVIVASLAVFVVVKAGPPRQPAVARSRQPAVLPTGSACPALRASGPLVTGRGWSSTGIAGVMPSPGSCHYRHAVDGEPLPDPHCTPGAVDLAVTTATLRTTLCRPGGYTPTVRPPLTISEPVKLALLDAYSIPRRAAAHYELDHLVPLSAGGSSDIHDLWPEPNTFQRYQPSTYIHNDKDALVDWTFHALCAGTVTLAAVQHGFATDWTTALTRLHLPPIPPGYTG